MDLLLLVIAYGFGMTAAAMRLPPLVGYLAAGFVLHAFDYESTELIETIADAGILLLLFGIGLKLDLPTLVRPEVAGTASIFSIIATIVPASVLLAADRIGLPLADDLTLTSAMMVAFGLSFSSTVFAAKAMERTNETESLSGRIAIGVLVIQDVMAVVFIVMLGSSWPSPWLIAVVVGILAARPLLGWLLTRTGHGELLVLYGFVLAIGIGAELFDAVDLKPDLGALFIGIV
ncbi:MAG: potassium transporter Kef, partial [Acidimicrobiales bacterium]|nr:potassium transporter Kef [Acidimicrobiales bacterium]